MDSRWISKATLLLPRDTRKSVRVDTIELGLAEGAPDIQRWISGTTLGGKGEEQAILGIGGAGRIVETGEGKGQTRTRRLS